MKRREFITLLGGAAATWPLAASAQQPGERMRRVGVLVALPEDDANMKARLAALRQGLERRGWSDGRNIRIDYRHAPAGNHVQALAKELVALQPDVLVAHTVTPAAALQRETREIPIVFVSIGDPIGFGFINSLSRPGGNFTGLTTFERSIAGKWFSMLRVCPGTSSRITKFSEHEADRCEAQECQRLAIEVLPILGKPSAAVEPGDGALDNPTAGKHHESLGVIERLMISVSSCGRSFVSARVDQQGVSRFVIVSVDAQTVVRIGVDLAPFECECLLAAIMQRLDSYAPHSSVRA